MWTLKSKGRYPKNKGYPTILGYPKIDDGPLPDNMVSVYTSDAGVVHGTMTVCLSGFYDIFDDDRCVGRW